MKKRYAFTCKNWLRAGLFGALAAITCNLQAQNIPVKLWDKTFGGSSTNGLSALLQTSDGGYILGGQSDSGISGDKSEPAKGGVDYWVVKLDANANKLWDKTIGGSNHDQFPYLKQTADGGYILGGTSMSGIGGDKSQANKGIRDYWVVKLDGSGNKTWDKTFGGNEDDVLSCLQQTADGGYILGGWSNSGISGDKSQPVVGSIGGDDFWVIKLDANGNKTWDKTFGGSDYDGLNSLQQTSDGGYILGGWSNSGIGGDKSQANKGSTDYWLIKLDSNGNKTWDKTLGGSDYDKCISLIQTSDGGYLLGGFSDSNISGDKTQAAFGGYSDYWIIKTDGNGNKIWDKTFGGSALDELSCLQQTSDGGYILGGYSQSNISGNKTQNSRGGEDYWVVKTDPAGNKLWDQTLGGNNDDRLWALQQNSNGDFMLGGTTLSGINGDKSQASKGLFDYWVIKLGAVPTGVSDAETGFGISISPNPSQGKFTLQFSNITAAQAEITVFDLLGRVILQKNLPVTADQASLEITLPKAKGMYLLQLKGGGQILTRKIVVE